LKRSIETATDQEFGVISAKAAGKTGALDVVC
jgi:hypothetical protein